MKYSKELEQKNHGKRKKKIIILTYYRFPCTEPVLENVFAKELGKKFEIIWLFQGDVSKGRKQKWHNSRVLLVREIKKKNLMTKVVNRLFLWGRFLQLIRLLSMHDIKIVMVRDLPLMALLVIQLKRFFGFKVYYQSSGLEGDLDIFYHRLTKPPKRYYYLILGLIRKFLGRHAIKRADIIFPITDFHKEKLLNYTLANKLVPLTMGVDEKWVQRDKEEIPHLRKLKEKAFILVYFGSLSFLRKPKFILAVFAEVKKKIPNCKLLLIGQTASFWEDKELQEYCSNLRIKEAVTFTGQLDRNSLQNHLQYCDLSISVIPPEAHYKISSPTKVYESLGNGLPVVANKEIFEQEKVIRESGGGVLVDYNTISFSRAIVTLLRNNNLRKKMARNGKEYVLKHYSYRVIAEKIAPYFEAGIK